jgi:TonB family protein
MFATAIPAQEPTPTPGSTECSFQILRGSAVDKRVKILSKPEPHFTTRDREKYTSQVITLTAVFCGSGAVTDIRVTKGLSDTMDEEAIKAARKIQFTPAEKNGQKVSQVLVVAYLVRRG